MVPRKRLELLHRKATASKTVVSTNSTTWASKNKVLQRHIQETDIQKFFEFMYLFVFKWWAGRDSNPRRRSQRIYSPPHLTTLVPTHKKRIENSRFFDIVFSQKSNILNSKIPESGATNQTWTDDRRFTKPMLYQLSYGGARADCIKNDWLVKKFFYNMQEFERNIPFSFFATDILRFLIFHFTLWLRFLLLLMGTNTLMEV